MSGLGWGLLGAGGSLFAYSYLGYPALLWVLRRRRRAPAPGDPRDRWPFITITVPAFNEEESIADTLDRILASDYPADRRQVLVISDASDDRTDEIVEGYADRGVELLRVRRRSGKSAAENAALPHLRGEIVVNTDASVRLHPDAVPRLVAAFRDPTVGLASGRDVSVTHFAEEANVGEAGYVGYEMWVRDLETDVAGIVGASGCLYAIRADLHRHEVPPSLSRDFAAALTTREHGFRAVSVWDAVCFVPRVSSLRREYRRKVRTVARGLGTLLYKRRLLNPLRFGFFSFMLFSHKLCRWLVPWGLVAGVVGVALLSIDYPLARWALAGALGLVLCAIVGWLLPEGSRMPKVFGVPAYGLSGNVAVLRAWLSLVRGEVNAVWEPTRRRTA